MATVDLNSLLRRTTIDDHEEVLSAANNVLQKSPKDIDAQHTKIVALIKLDRFDDALRALKTGGAELRERAQLEHAYALYKAGKLEDAGRVVQKEATTRGLQHVEAQILYRAEQFDAAAKLYNELATGPSKKEGEENDLRINSRAVDAQLQWAGKGELAVRRRPAREDLEAFETAYNMACGCIARGELSQCEMLLKRARGMSLVLSADFSTYMLMRASDLCNALEDMSQAEKEAEILPITVQQIYVLSQQGKTDEVEKLASSLKTAE